MGLRNIETDVFSLSDIEQVSLEAPRLSPEERDVVDSTFCESLLGLMNRKDEYRRYLSESTIKLIDSRESREIQREKGKGKAKAKEEEEEEEFQTAVGTKRSSG